MYRKGKPLEGEATKSDIVRFVNGVNMGEPAACWNWTGYCDRDGYGCIKWRGKKIATHRFAFTIWCEPLKPGNDVHHKCFNRKCVNPTHLEQTSREWNAANRGNTKPTREVA